MNWLKKGLLAMSFFTASLGAPKIAGAQLRHDDQVFSTEETDRMQGAFINLLRNPYVSRQQLLSVLKGCAFERFNGEDLKHLNDVRAKITQGKTRQLTYNEARAALVMMHQREVNAVFDRVVHTIADPKKGRDDIVKAMDGYVFDVADNGGLAFRDTYADYIGEARAAVLKDPARPASYKEVMQMMRVMDQRDSNGTARGFAWFGTVVTTVIAGGVLLSRKK